MPPIAIAAASPDRARVGRDGQDHEQQERGQHELPEERLRLRAGRQRRADVRDVPERGAQERGGGERAGDLREPVRAGTRAREVAREHEGEGHGRVEVRARDVTDRVDHRHDHEPERDRDADVAELAGLRVDHDRAAAGEDQRERADRLGRERADHASSSSATSRCDARVDLVADPAHRLEVLPGRVVELPVLVALARVDRARVAAAHRDDDVGGADGLIGERLRELLAQVDAELAHCLDDRGVDPLARRASRPSGRGPAPCERQLDQRGPSGHPLAAAPALWTHTNETTSASRSATLSLSLLRISTASRSCRECSR